MIFRRAFGSILAFPVTMNAFARITLFPALACLWAVLTLPAPAMAEMQTLYAQHTYLMGDGDTKAEARLLCFQEAKRKLLEQVGVYVQSLSRTDNFQLAQDEVVSYSAALVSVVTEDESVALVDGSMALTLTVRAEVDPEQVRRDLMEHGPKLLEQNSAASSNASGASPETPEESADNGAEDSGEPADPELQHAVVVTDMAVAGIRAAEYTQKGMTRDQVASMLGAPGSSRTNAGYQCDSYGTTWVVYRAGVVSCVRNRLEYHQDRGGDCHCDGFSFTFVTR